MVRHTCSTSLRSNTCRTDSRAPRHDNLSPTARWASTLSTGLWGAVVVVALVCGACTGGSARLRPTLPPPLINSSGPNSSLPTGSTIRITSVDPYRVLAVTRRELHAHGFLLARAGSSVRIRVTESVATRTEAYDFPSRVPPLIGPVFLVRYISLNAAFSPPFHKFVTCWLFVVHASIPGLPPPVVSTPEGLTWTAILINAETGDLQQAFVGRSVLRISPSKA